MPLQRKRQNYFGDSQTDIRDRLLIYSEGDSYPAQYFADAVCGCGSRLFTLLIDDMEGAAVRV